MRLRFFTAILTFLCASVFAAGQAPAAPTCADLHLVPAVRECVAIKVVPIGSSGLSVLPAKDFEDEFTAEDLRQTTAGRAMVGKAALVIRFERITNSARAKELLERHHLAYDPAMHDEGYAILPESNGLTIIAETPAGMFYGAQTAKQLIHWSGNSSSLLIPTVRDWPAMAHRGLSDDWSRGPLPTMDFVKREIRTLAAYKYNIFSPYFEHTFKYASTPLAGFPGGALTPDEAREIVAYAARYHITIIPEQEAFGHLHHVLKFEQYSPLGETPHGEVLAPGDPSTLPLIKTWFGELAEVFPGPYAHIGADETAELGTGRTRDAVKQQGLGKVYLGFLSSIHAALEPNHKRLLFWGDIAETQPELVGTLPKDMIAVPWHYDAQPDFTKAIEPFIKAGLETWVAPGVNNWSRLYPNNNEALGNIRVFVRDGQKLGATGMLNTVWNDDGEGIFDENWFGVLFGAAAAWQPGESSQDQFMQSFSLAFHGDQTGKVSEAQRELIAAHATLHKAGLEDAGDRLFWVDPFSSEGQRIAAKMRPVLSELRLHAERAATLVDQARNVARKEGRALANEEALQAMELGARRIDFVGLKFQDADECMRIYSQALAIAGDKARWEEVDQLLWSDNQRFRDLRDGYVLLGTLYRDAWLRVDRPYWLDNNRIHFDRAAELWMERGDRWDTVQQQWSEAHTLRPAAEVGLPAAPGN